MEEVSKYSERREWFIQS